METHLKIFIFLTLLILNSVATQPLPQAEWRALLALRSSLGISAKLWHKKANPCSNWTGIACGNGRVIGIKLSGLRRSVQGKLIPGFDVDSLPKFDLLKSFNSSGFLLRGSIPEWLGRKLSNLEVLDLSSSSIYGSIPTSLASLSKLKSLRLSNNSIAGNLPSSLDKLVSLSVLDLAQNLLTGQIPSEISALGNLTILDLSSNYFSGSIPPDFGSLSRLKLLNLSRNSVSSSIPPQLGNLSELVQLDLESNSLYGSLPLELTRLPSLKRMLIGNNELRGSLSDDLFKSLIQLEDLVLCRNNFAGNLPDALWSMPRLKSLDVSGNNLTGEFSAHFNLTGVVFNFSDNLFYGNLSYEFGTVGIVDLSNNYLQGSPPDDSKPRFLLSGNCLSSVPDQRNRAACSKFYADKKVSPYGDDKLKPPLVQPIKSRKRLAYVMIGVFGGIGFIIVLTGMLLLIKACKFGNTNHHRPNVGGVEEGGSSPKAFIDVSALGESFTYEQILVATSNFSSENLLKEGHSGDLFRGTLEGGSPVVIKRVVRKESLMSELELLSKVAHERLVPLVGYCLEDENHKFLVYKYLPNGDLSNALYRVTNAEEGLKSLDWITRLKIAIGAAEALSYFHHECTPPLVHRDIRATSILLDDKYEVRLGSLSDVCAADAGNYQNMVARLLRTPQTSGKRPSGSSSITRAYDVYCFGKVLLELVSGNVGISTLSDADAKQWLDNNLPSISMYEKDMVIRIVDQSLMIDEDLLEEVWAVAVVAKSCLNPKPSRRPSMKYVLKALENPFKVVRQENFSSGSRQSWTAALFGSWNHSSSGSSNMSSQTNREIVGGLRQTERVCSRGSGTNDHSSSHKRSSSDVFPVEMIDVERQDGTS
ncbi:hypothetical protein ACS0TY_013629 [Phlomoides rotata]